jgi:hypothetical protein
MEPTDKELSSSVLRPPLGAVEAKMMIYKKGRSTDITKGEVNSIKVDINLTSDSNKSPNKRPNKRPCRAWVVKPEVGYAFAKPGDSGALAWNKVNKSWCGLIFAGDENTGEGYMIPADVLVADVKTMTGMDLSVVDTV